MPRKAVLIPSPYPDFVPLGQPLLIHLTIRKALHPSQQHDPLPFLMQPAQPFSGFLARQLKSPLSLSFLNQYD